MGEDNTQDIITVLEETAEQGYKFDIGKYFSDGWQLGVKIMLSNFGFMALALVIFVVSAIIPIVGALALFFYLMPALLIGPYFAAHKAKIGAFNFDSYFLGFSAGNYFGYFWVMFLFIILTAIPGQLYLYFSGFWDALITQNLDNAQAGRIITPMQIFPAGYWVVTAITFIVTMFLYTSQLLSFPIIVSSKIGGFRVFKYSMRIVRKNFWWFLLLNFIFIIINYIGALLLGAGLIVTVPFTVGVFYSIYHDIIYSKVNDTDDLKTSLNDVLDA